jgi:homoserine kinase
VPRADAIYNLQRVLSLVHALQHGEYDRLRESVKDRLHQSARAALVPLLTEALALEDPDILGAFLSGAGPSVALLSRRDTRQVERRVASMYEQAGVEAQVRALRVHDSPSVWSEPWGMARRTV